MKHMMGAEKLKSNGNEITYNSSSLAVLDSDEGRCGIHGQMILHCGPVCDAAGAQHHRSHPLPHWLRKRAVLSQRPRSCTQRR